MRRLIVAAVASLGAFAAMAAERTAQADKAFANITGIPSTGSEQQIQGAFPGLRCTIPGELCLAPGRQLGAAEMTDVTISLSHGRLQSILMNLRHRDFQTVKKYLIQKYGRPTVTNPLSSVEPTLIWTGRAVDLYLDSAQGEPMASLMFVVIGTGSPAERKRR